MRAFLLNVYCISITFPLHVHCISYALHFHWIRMFLISVSVHPFHLLSSCSRNQSLYDFSFFFFCVRLFVIKNKVVKAISSPPRGRKPPSHIRMIKNLNPLQQPKKWNLSTMLTATKQVKPFLLALATCISAALDCSWTALGCCWGLSWHVSCLNRTKECHLPGSECHHGFRMPSSGGSAGLQRGRPAYTKHRSRSHKEGTSVGKF